MSDDIKYMPIEEFRDQGYLQEVNRQFFHPLGLALELDWDADGVAFLSGVWDYRDDPEGMRYGPGMLDGLAKARADRIYDERAAKATYRVETLGWVVQPFEFNAGLAAEAAVAAKDPEMIASMEQAERDLDEGKTIPLADVAAEIERGKPDGTA